MLSRMVLTCLIVLPIMVSAQALNSIISASELKLYSDTLRVFNQQKNIEAASKLLQKVLPQYRATQQSLPTDVKADFVHEHLGFLTNSTGKWVADSIRSVCRELLQVREPVLSDDPISRYQISAIFLLARGYRKDEQQDSALYYGQKAFRYFEQFPKLNDHIRYAPLLVLMGNLYSDRDEPLKSVNFQKQALAISKSQKKYKNAYIICTNLVNEYLKLGNYEDVLETTLEAEKMLELDGKEDQYLDIDTKIKLANAYYFVQNPEKSAEYIQMAKTKLASANLSQSDSLYFNFQIALRLSSLNDSLRESYKRIAYENAKQLNFHEPELLRAPLTYVEELLKSKKYAEAIIVLHSVIPYTKLPDGTLRSYGFLSSFEAMAAFAQAKLFEQTGNNSALTEAINHISRVIDLEKERLSPKKKFTSFEPHTETLERLHPARFVHCAMRTIGSAYYGNEALIRQMELFKASKMKAAVRKDELGDALGVDKKLLNEEKRVNRLIADLEKVLADTSLSEMQIMEKRAEWMLLREQLTKLEQLMREKHPDFVERIYTSPDFDVASYCRQLDPHEVVIMYSYGYDTIVGCALTQQDFYCKALGSTKHIEDLITQMRSGLTRYHTTSSATDDQLDIALKSYQNAAVTLYQILLAPFQASLKPQIQIIPERKLFELPYSALLTQQPKPGAALDEFPFAVLQYRISISHSLESYQKQRHHARKRENWNIGWMGLAPLSDATDPKLALPTSEKEVKELSTLMRGVALVGKKADLAGFTMAKDAEMIHIATHSITKAHFDQNDYILLANGEPFTTHQISLLDVHARFCFLSSCNSARGVTTAQEGLLGISRAFAMAGTPCIIATLWPIDDRVAPKFAKLFYSYLIKGKTVAESMRAAQLDCIKSTDGLSVPFYWAGYTLTGAADMRFTIR